MPHKILMRWLGLVIAAQVMMLATPQFTSGAAAGDFCNETSYVLQMSVAHKSVAHKSVTSRVVRGWYALLPGACFTPKEQTPKNSALFVHAYSDEAHSAPDDALVFDGDVLFCANPHEDFQFTNKAQGGVFCHTKQASTAVPLGFAPVAKNGTVRFAEKQNFSRKRAIIAGVQRLLRDLGYDIGAIDGIGGGRTRAAINAYRGRENITSQIDNAALMRHLLKTLRRDAKKRGLHICNNTKTAVRVAIGQVVKAGFRSQGWFVVAAGACRPSLAQKLDDRYYFYYAEAIAPSLAQNLIAGDSVKTWRGRMPLCTKHTRFVLDTHEHCAARGLDETLFRKIDTKAAIHWQIDLD